MTTKAQLVAWAIERYKQVDGAGSPSLPACSVTTAHVQIRDEDGILLAEYERDFVEYKLATPSECESNEIMKQESAESSSNPSLATPKHRENPTSESKEVHDKATPTGVLLALFAIFAMFGGLFLVGRFSIPQNSSGPSVESTSDAQPTTNPFSNNEKVQRSYYVFMGFRTSNPVTKTLHQEAFRSCMSAITNGIDQVSLNQMLNNGGEVVQQSQEVIRSAQIYSETVECVFTPYIIKY